MNGYAGLIIATLLIIAFVMILIATKDKFKSSSHPKKHLSERDINKLNQAIERHNESARAWNVISADLNEILDYKQREIIIARDGQANMTLSNLVREFNEVSESVNDYMRRSGSAIDDRNATGSVYCLDRLTDLYARARGIISVIKSMDVTNCAGSMNYRQNYRSDNADETAMPHANASFFGNCKDKSDIESRYRSLAKAFHPDNKGGDKAMFEELQRQYTLIKEHYE